MTFENDNLTLKSTLETRSLMHAVVLELFTQAPSTFLGFMQFHIDYVLMRKAFIENGFKVLNYFPFFLN